jgi:hypothetical protein
MRRSVLALDNWLTRLADQRPDRATRRYFEHRERHVYPYLRRKGLHVVRRQNRDAAPDRVHAAAAARGVVLITGAAHGTPTSILGGAPGVAAFSVGEFPDAAVEGKIVHFAACLCAQRLGPEMVRAGARAFFGYDGILQFAPDHGDALPAMELDAMIDRLLVDGKPVGDVFQLVQDWAADEAFRLAHRGRAAAAAHLRQTAAMLRRFGDDSAYLQLS